MTQTTMTQPPRTQPAPSAAPGDRRRSLLFWAAGLILAGGLLLVFNLGLLDRYEPLAQYVVAGLLALGGAAILISYLVRRTNYWRLMPGWTLLALAALVYLSTLPTLPRPYLAAVIFVGLALAFTNVYFVNRAEHWWAIIPGGFMLVLGIVIALTVTVTRLETLGTVLFVGMGLVFFLVYLLAGARRHWWALIPGGVLVLFGMLAYTADNEVQGALLRWWPAALLVIGAVLAWIGATLPPATPPRFQVNVAPPQPPVKKSSPVPPLTETGRLGDYSQPAPGASVEILPDPDERS
jgi:hypothetical protein